MVERPFHHGNLRAELLDHAEAVLREDGADGVSLRDLARRAGVSHGAPRSHFVDRQALLDALAVRGFERLGERLRTAGTLGTASTGTSFEEAVQRVARAYVDFAVQDAALMELMFAAKTDHASEAVERAAAGLFATFDELLDQHRLAEPMSPHDRQRFGLLFAAAVQGTASLVGSRRISADQGAALVDDATGILVRTFFPALRPAPAGGRPPAAPRSGG